MNEKEIKAEINLLKHRYTEILYQLSISKTDNEKRNNTLILQNIEEWLQYYIQRK